MRSILKLLFIIIILFFIGYGFNSVILNSYATNQFLNTFIPSETNLNEIEANNVSLLTPMPSAKTFNEFTDQNIEKNGFYIRIDKINLFKKVVKDVDPRYKDVYVKSWETGVSHGKFTAYPDQIGITYLFGHATGNKTNAVAQNAWFSNLDQLLENDQVILYYNGVKYTYEINEIHIVSPDATGFYTGASPIAKVRLQYCGPPTGSLNLRTLVDGILVKTEKLV